MNHITQIVLGALHLGLCQTDLHHRIFYLFHYFFFCVNRKITCLRIDVDLHIVSLSEMVLAGSQKRILNGLQQCFLADIFFFFQQIQCFN